MPQDAPVGERFSHVYIERGKPASDTERMRRRFLSQVRDFFEPNKAAKILRQELGVDVSTPYLDAFIIECRVEDLLDAVTIFYRVLYSDDRVLPRSENAKDWIVKIQKIFREENVGYSIDAKGGVHFSLDEEFERVRIVAVQGLGKSRYGAVRHEFVKAFSALDSVPPDTKTAVRAAFESVEILFKLIVDDTKCQRLGIGEIGTFLKPRIEKVYGADPTAKQATNLLVNSMADWVSAVHYYRHGQAVEEPASPPLEICAVMLSQAAIYLRWLIYLDEKLKFPAVSSLNEN